MRINRKRVYLTIRIKETNVQGSDPIVGSPSGKATATGGNEQASSRREG
jgi:hypothetical protein